MASNKKIVSNRMNAKKSTGPKTKTGKAIVSKNAIKHGIFAKEVVITTGDGAENSKEFELMLKRFIRYYRPEGIQETLLVEKIVVDTWRLKRLIRFENGLLCHGLYDFKEKTFRDFNLRGQNYLFHYGGIDSVPPKPIFEMYSYDSKISEEDLELEIARVMKITDDDEAFKSDNEFLRYFLESIDIFEFNEETKQIALDHLNNCSSETFADIRQEFLDIEDEIIKEKRAFIEWQNSLEYEERMRRIPLEKEIERIIKYETHLERMITKNISLLLTLQQNRLARNFKEIKTRLN